MVQTRKLENISTRNYSRFRVCHTAAYEKRVAENQNVMITPLHTEEQKEEEEPRKPRKVLRWCKKIRKSLKKKSLKLLKNQRLPQVGASS